MENFIQKAQMASEEFAKIRQVIQNLPDTQLKVIVRGFVSIYIQALEIVEHVDPTIYKDAMLSYLTLVENLVKVFVTLPDFTKEEEAVLKQAIEIVSPKAEFVLEVYTNGLEDLNKLVEVATAKALEDTEVARLVSGLEKSGELLGELLGAFVPETLN